MKYWEDFVCGTIIIVIGVLIIFPPKPEPVCPMCGPLTKFLFSDIAAFVYIALGSYSLFNGFRQRQKGAQSFQ